MSTDERSLSTPITRGLRARCPCCGEGALFDGFLTLRPKCERCGLDYSFADAADGPAVFVIFISGFIVVFAALAVEFAYQPSYWVHAMLWLPLIALTTLGPLRPIKGVMIALQYHHKAAEGRLSRGE
jgi:uncharacterized protein (DUF983 family)